MLDLSKAAYCTPVVTSIAISVLVLLVLLVQLLSNLKSKRSRKELGMSLIVHFLWAAVIIGMMFYLCANGKITSSWILFSILYLAPIAIFFIAMASRAYGRATMY